MTWPSPITFGPTCRTWRYSYTKPLWAPLHDSVKPVYFYQICSFNPYLSTESILFSIITLVHAYLNEKLKIGKVCLWHVWWKYFVFILARTGDISYP